MKGIIDRFEGEFAVIEVDGNTQDVSRSLIADGVQQGDVVELVNGIWNKNTVATEKRSKEIKKLMDSVWED